MNAQLNLGLARAGADEGMTAAAEHANAMIPNWRETALGFFLMYISEHRGLKFMIEDVRIWSERRGLPAPPDRRAWGAITRKAKGMHLMKFEGHAQQKSVNCHGSPKAIWRAT